MSMVVTKQKWPVDHPNQPKDTLQGTVPSNHADSQADIRAPKRMCLTGPQIEPGSHNLVGMLAQRVSSILQADCGETMAALFASIQYVY